MINPQANSTSDGIHRLKSSGKISANDLLCFLPVRNEILRLPAVLDHHRRLGINHFIVVDNGSSDGTTDYLMTQSDVDLYTTEASFSASHCGFDWLHPLLDEFGSDHWVLTIDSDELFTFPHVEHVSLQQFCQFLDRKNAQAVFAVLLDMYSDRSIEQTAYATGEPLLDACPYFDSGPYEVIRGNIFPTVELRGGTRRRAFWDRDVPFFPPTLSKVPLVKWQRGYRYIACTHYMKPSPNNLSEITGALLHFKFLAGFRQRVELEVAREEHFAQAREYKNYLKKMEQNPSLSLMFPESVRYENSEQLVKLRHLQTSWDWESFVQLQMKQGTP